MQNQTSYRIRTTVNGASNYVNAPISIPVQLTQTFENFEILSLNINEVGDYRKYTSNEGVVVGRVCAANTGLGVPNAKVSIFIPRGKQETDAERMLYPYKEVGDKDGNRVRYNLLPNDSDDACYQVVGTFPNKREVLDNEEMREIFEKYYVHTTVTNEAGDYMLPNIPVGQHILHVDIDLSDIGPFLSQKPRDMINNGGYSINQFDSVTKFKQSRDLEELSQVYTQNRGVYVYPYWGDNSEDNSDSLKITRCDIDLNYDFQTSAVFMGSVVTDQKSNYISKNCTPRETAGRMENLITGEGMIEMIRLNRMGKIEQFRIKGDRLIDSNGVWCYSIPMNLDYVTTDEYGNIIPTDNPERGLPTRARVRFRITLDDDLNDTAVGKRCRYLVPNNPHWEDERVQEVFNKEGFKDGDRDIADYEFGTKTHKDSFVDLFINKVYTVKNYIPVLKKNESQTNREMSGIKAINYYGDNNPFPYNNLSIKLKFAHRFLCVLLKAFINLVGFLNYFIQAIMVPFCALDALLKTLGKIPLVGYAFKGIREVLTKPIVANVTCVSISEEFCDTGTDSFVTYPGCGNGAWSASCTWDMTKRNCAKEQQKKVKGNQTPAVCTNSRDMLYDCVENMLAQDNDAPNFNFGNDWVNGVLYMPLWARRIRPKKRYFFGLIKSPARDFWCTSTWNGHGVKLYQQCAYERQGKVNDKSFANNESRTYLSNNGDNTSCKDCIEKRVGITLQRGIIKSKDTIYRENEDGRFAKVYYYVPAEWNGDEELTRLYATDIVLLGSINDCDINGVSQFFKNLPQSTYNMPTNLLFTDYEFKFGINYDVKDKADKDSEYVVMDVDFHSESAGADRGYKTSEGGRGGLFYDIGCSSYDTDVTTCINLERVCELGVTLDETFEVKNLNETGYENDATVMTDGFISYDEISNFDARSMFATMNGNKLATVKNRYNGLKEYDFRVLYTENFDGGLRVPMSKDKGPTAQKNATLEQASTDYLHFRMGDNPYYYYNNVFPRWENSFYFYFGLKNGRTAIDKLNELYIASCTSDDNAFPIDVDSSPNSWCAFEGEEDGFLSFNLEKVNAAPYKIILNSRTEAGLAYTVWKDGTDELKYNLVKIGNYEKEGWDTYQCTVRRDDDASQKDLRMVKNGEYHVVVIDNNGEIYEDTIRLFGKPIDFTLVSKNFAIKQTDFDAAMTDLYGEEAEHYKCSQGSKVDANPPLIPHYEWDVDDENGVGFYRTFINGDKKPQELDRVNGTICVNGLSEWEERGIKYVSLKVVDVTDGERFIWEKEDLVEHPLPDGTKEKSLMINFNSWRDDSGILAFGDDYFGVGVDKVDHEYSVIIRQYCLDEESGALIPTENVTRKTIKVGEPKPYKLKINDIDYDYIKGLNDSEGNNLKWLNLGDVANYSKEISEYTEDELKGWNVSRKYIQSEGNTFTVQETIKQVNWNSVDITDMVANGTKIVYVDKVSGITKMIGRDTFQDKAYQEPEKLAASGNNRYYYTIPDTEQKYFDPIPYYTNQEECVKVGDIWLNENENKVYVLTDTDKRTFEPYGNDGSVVTLMSGINRKDSRDKCTEVNDGYVEEETKNVYVLVRINGDLKYFNCVGSFDVREYFEIVPGDVERYKYLGNLTGDGVMLGRKKTDVPLDIDKTYYYNNNGSKVEIYLDGQYRLRTRALQNPVNMKDIVTTDYPKQFMLTYYRDATAEEMVSYKQDIFFGEVRKAFCMTKEDAYFTFEFTTEGEDRPIDITVIYDKESVMEEGDERHKIITSKTNETLKNNGEIKDILIPTITDQYNMDYNHSTKDTYYSYVLKSEVKTNGESIPYRGRGADGKNIKNVYGVSCRNARGMTIPSATESTFNFHLLDKRFRIGASMTWSAIRVPDYRTSNTLYLTGLYSAIVLNGVPESREAISGVTIFSDNTYGNNIPLNILSTPLMKSEDEVRKDEFAVPTTRLVYSPSLADNKDATKKTQWRTSFDGFKVFGNNEQRETTVGAYKYWKPVKTGFAEYIQIDGEGGDISLRDSVEDSITKHNSIIGNINIKNNVERDGKGVVTSWDVSVDNDEEVTVWIIEVSSPTDYPIRWDNGDLGKNPIPYDENVYFVDKVMGNTMGDLFQWGANATDKPNKLKGSNVVQFEEDIMPTMPKNYYYLVAIDEENRRAISPLYDNTTVTIDAIVIGYRPSSGGEKAKIMMGVSINETEGYMTHHSTNEMTVEINSGSENQLMLDDMKIWKDGKDKTADYYHNPNNKHSGGRTMHLTDMTNNVGEVINFLKSLGVTKPMSTVDDVIELISKDNVLVDYAAYGEGTDIYNQSIVRAMGGEGNYTNLSGYNLSVKASVNDCTNFKRKVGTKGSIGTIPFAGGLCTWENGLAFVKLTE